MKILVKIFSLPIFIITFAAISYATGTVQNSGYNNNPQGGAQPHGRTIGNPNPGRNSGYVNTSERYGNHNSNTNAASGMTGGVNSHNAGGAVGTTTSGNGTGTGAMGR